ncbi:MAG: hypothetical protein ABIN36_03745 [Ferruginibacter sp.]
MMKIKRFKLLLLLLLLRLFASGQTAGFHYRGDLDSIKETGIYSIELSPEINAHLKTDFSDFRIINEMGKWIPNFTRHPNKEGSGYYCAIDLNIIKLISSKNNTTLIVATYENNISHVILNLNNTDAERFCNITGSDDLSNWFAISDSVVISHRENYPGNVIAYLRIFFPEVNYKYLKFNIDNKGKAPLNIISIMKDSLVHIDKFSKERLPQPNFENPNTTIIQKDSGKKSYIKIIQPEAFLVGGLELAVTGAKFYERNVKVYKPLSENHSFANPGNCIDSFKLSNSNPLRFSLHNRIAVREFYLLIENNDSPPLKIETVKTASQYTVATAWLEKGHHYSIIMDNSMASEPVYDFKEKNIMIGEEYTILKHGPIMPIVQTPTASNSKKNNTIIWLFIAIAILVLAFFTYKLITDINKPKS